MSKKYSLNREDMKSIGINVGIVMLSAGITQLLSLLPDVELGGNNEIVLIVITAILKTAQKYLQGK